MLLETLIGLLWFLGSADQTAYYGCKMKFSDNLTQISITLTYQCHQR